MKCSDITDEQIYAAIRACREAPDYSDRRSLLWKAKPRLWVSRWDIHAQFPGVPVKLIDAKLYRMVHRNRLEGCSVNHNCRGDFYLPGED